ncbi:hypothetical protein J5690_02070 [bacterium]|nr:hypothetical protein [bacterium]
MKKFFIFLVLFLVAFQVIAKDEKPKLVVMDCEDLSKRIKPKALSDTTEYLRMAFANTNKYIIIPKEQQKKQISKLKKDFNTNPSYKSSNDKNYQIQLGQALAADIMVKTTITYFGGSFTISSELIDITKEATIVAAKEEYNGSQKELKIAIDKIVNKIIEVTRKKENVIKKWFQDTFTK